MTATGNPAPSGGGGSQYTDDGRPRRGWFGEPWPSGTCYDDGGRLRTETHKPTPTGEDCALCGTPVEQGDRGQAIPHADADGNATVRHAHAECMLREVTGPPEHLDGRCTCRDPQAAPTGRTYRDEALDVWARLTGTARAT